MDIVAQRITLSDGESAERLPNVVRREVLDAHLSAVSVLERARARAERIVEEAEVVAARTREAAERERRGAEDRGYRTGLARGHAESAAELLNMSDMASEFVRDVEVAVVDVVTAAVAEIVARFDDVTLVEATVARSLRTLGDEVRATLHVPQTLRPEVERRVDEWYGCGSLRVVGDPSLRGSACRLECASMVITAGLDEQLAAMRDALEARIDERRCTLPERAPPRGVRDEFDEEEDDA